MRTPARMLLAALTLALPALAQIQAPAAPAKDGTEKLFKIETTGLGG